MLKSSSRLGLSLDAIPVIILEASFANSLHSVATKIDLYPGLPHAFGYFPTLSATRTLASDLFSAIKQINEGNLHS